MDTDFQSHIAARVSQEQVGHRLPSLALAVGIGGVPLALAAAGFADVEAQKPADGEVCYRIGSITKTFTAALVLSLCHTGEISVDSPVERYLPDTALGHLPLRMLLSHTSGLQREVPVPMWETMQGPSSAELREALRHADFVAAPGQRWHYSNLGYAVLGQIIEQVTGQPFEQAIEQTFLRPLELADTRWSPPADAAIGYRLDPFADIVHREPIMDQAAIGAGGQLWSTPTDLLRWGYALCGGTPDVIAPAVIEAMHTVHVMVDTTTWTRGWGLGLILERRGDRVLAGHTGAMPGFQSAFTVDRANGIVVAALTNSTRGITLADLTAELAIDASTAHPGSPTASWQPGPPPPPEIANLLGSWWSESDEIIFEWHRDGLHAHLATNPAGTDTHFAGDGPNRFRGDSGRLQGELLLITRSPCLQLHWATYPLTRIPR